MTIPEQQPAMKQTKQSGPIVAHSKRASKRKETGQPDQPVCQPDAAGIDIGAREIYVAVPADRDANPVRKCGTFTEDLNQMAEWLVSVGIKTAANALSTLAPMEPPECIGFLCTMYWKRMALMCAW